MLLLSAWGRWRAPAVDSALSLPANRGATPAALPPSAAVSVGGAQQPSVPSTRPLRPSPLRPPACSQLLVGPPVVAAWRRVVVCGLHPSHLSSSRTHFSTSEQRHINSLMASSFFSISPRPPRQSRPAVTPKADISSHAAVSNFLMQCYQIAKINLEPMNAPHVWHGHLKRQHLKAHWRDKLGLGRRGMGSCEMPTRITRNNAGWTFEVFSKCLLNPHSTT